MTTTASLPPKAVSPPCVAGEAVAGGAGLVQLLLHRAGAAGGEEEETSVLSLGELDGAGKNQGQGQEEGADRRRLPIWRMRVHRVSVGEKSGWLRKARALAGAPTSGSHRWSLSEL